MVLLNFASSEKYDEIVIQFKIERERECLAEPETKQSSTSSTSLSTKISDEHREALNSKIDSSTLSASQIP